MPGKPKAEVEIRLDLVRTLLEEQHPDLAHLELRLVASGWDNVMFRLGSDYAVRLPRRKTAVPLIVNEQAWLPVLAPRLPIPVPVPLRVGRPTADYPWHWSALPWIEGECDDEAPLSSKETGRFADFLIALHEPAPDDAPTNDMRGCRLLDREDSMRTRLTTLRGKTSLIGRRIESVWDGAVTAPETTARCWVHGDLHSQNVLVSKGRITGIIDWGDLASGDVATDLAGVWSLFESPADRRRALERYAPGAATLARTLGWAALFGVALLDAGLVNSPRHARAGEQILRRLLDDDSNQGLPG